MSGKQRPKTKQQSRKKPAKKISRAIVVVKPRTPVKKIKAEPTLPEIPYDGGFPIVAVGASAGGLEAFELLLGTLPSDTRLSFVIIQHLSPAHESMLPQILSKKSPLPVSEAREGMEVESGRIYVASPNATLTVAKCRLRLAPRQGQARHMPIDAFLRSLAVDQPHRAIAVILSGAGSDGSLGLQEIKAAGGITFAQDGKSAKFDLMPHSAISTGAVDFVLPPDEIARELARISLEFPQGVPSGEREIHSLEQEQLGIIFGILRRTTGVDFSLYKQTTVRRRITRRMLLMKTESLGDYVELLKSRPAEVQALYHDVLIKVTSFFRDPDAFEALKKNVIPALLAKRTPNSPLRVWVPGCSTGEEVYSLAMLLMESLNNLQGNIPIQIFATDVSEEALAKARAGIYLENIALDVSPERLRRFFVRMDGYYQISKHVRDACIFARQDVAQDPPFSRIDLISCRNLLIYLDAYLQKKVFPVFHYALKPGGYLMLGTSETVGSTSDLFNLADEKSKIYTKKAAPSRFHMPAYRQPEPHPKPRANRLMSGAEVQKEVDRILLSSYSPAGVVVNGDMDIIQFRGFTGRYLEPASGQASLNLLRMVKSNLLMELKRTLEKARKDGTPARTPDLRMEAGRKILRIDIEAVPLSATSGGDNLFLVLFHEKTGAEIPAEEKDGKDKGRNRLEEKASRRLRKELEATREYLQSINEEQEATNEELKSANEEILSSNEELQSINEELETAKEELQSANEELTTLNEELQNRNQELNQVNNDMSNLLGSVNVPIIMLGHDLRVRRYTPMAEKIFKLTSADIGRPFAEIRGGFSPNDFIPLITEVIDSVSVKEIETQDAGGRWFSMRIRPYRTTDNKIDGAVLVFIDIDTLKKSLKLLDEARTYSESIVDTVRIPLLVVDPEGVIRTANRAYLESLAPNVEAVGKSLLDLGCGGLRIPALGELLHDVAFRNRPVRGREIHVADASGTRTFIVSIGPFRIENNQRQFLLMTLEEITDRKRADVEIQRLNAELTAHLTELVTSNERLEKEVAERKHAEEALQNIVSEQESLSYSVSHDLRAPLRAMLGVAEALAEDYKDKLDENGRDYIRRIAAAARRLDTLMQDLLVYNRMGKDHRLPQACSLDQSVAEAHANLEKEIKDSGASIEVEAPLGTVSGYVSLLDMIILNLISNALKFVPPGTKPKIRVRSEKDDGLVRLWVEDNGIGIHPDHHKLIFRVFERLHGVEQYPGTGIGLAIVRKGVDKMGGRVGVDSYPGDGSRFWIELPAGEGPKP